MAQTTSPAITAVGRRKTSVARVRLTPGSGKVSINQREPGEYLTVTTQRDLALLPLSVGESSRKYDVAIIVTGGGGTGQAGAISHGLARALLKAAPELKAELRQKGLLTRDPRMKERKKYGQPGARKRFQFSKR